LPRAESIKEISERLEAIKRLIEKILEDITHDNDDPGISDPD